MVAERNTTTTTAPRPPSTHHVRHVQTHVTGDDPRTENQAMRREGHQIRIDVDGVSSVNTKSLDSAGGVHVGKDDLDVGAEDQAA